MAFSKPQKHCLSVFLSMQQQKELPTMQLKNGKMNLGDLKLCDCVISALYFQLPQKFQRHVDLYSAK